MMDIFDTILKNMSSITAITAIIISIAHYQHSLSREKKGDTIKILSAIREKYPNSKELSEKQLKEYLTELEFFATGVNERIYDIKIVAKMSGKRLISQYNKVLKDFIDKRRAKQSSGKAYEEYEKMIKKLEKQYNKRFLWF